MGGRDSCIPLPFLVFKDTYSNYPIRNILDDVEGVTYRTGLKRMEDRTVMPQWLLETRFISALPHSRRWKLFVDNYSGHADTEEMRSETEKIRTDVICFPPNATHLLQSCDIFFIQRINRAWTTHWKTYKINMIKPSKWKDKSGRL